METISRSLLTFLINSLWQIPLAAGVAALACRFLRKDPASHRHAVWVTALVAALALPLASLRTAPALDFPRYSPSLAAAASSAPPTASRASAAAPSAASVAVPRTISIAQTLAGFLLGAYLLFMLFRLARLGWASVRTVRIRRAAAAGEIPLRLDRVRSRCQEAFGLSHVELLFSTNISGPVAAGRTVILPESLLAEASDDVLTTAVGHEMAHIARRDFACNLLYELLYLPVSFHPAAWLIHRGIERSREMACDELVTRRLMDAGVYARSIVSIAKQMTALPRPGYTLGVFDGDILEERIRRLVERPASNLRRARLLLASGLAALALCAVLASGLSVTARAQGTAGDIIAQGEAAYKRGDYKTAAAQFGAAVRFEPGNLKAKLFLASSLVAQYVPGTDPSSPLVNEARKQYMDVLAVDPGNKQAIREMMMLTSVSKQFAEAREWAEKAIQADSTDVAGYYTAGFVDWSMTYPDYMSARAAAGMKPQDSGIIPDPGLRQNVLAQHGGQVEDGLRMLQTALQLNPGFSDAMAYMNLLDRIKAGLADTPAEHDALIAQADAWVDKALDAKRRQAASPRPAQSANSDEPMATPLAPPPPPPPPPPGQGWAGGGMPAANGPRIQVEGSVQQAKLVSQTHPVYPPMARQAGITGTVVLGVLIGKDGTVQNLQVLSGTAALVAAAMQAVQQWKYQPTLLNGDPVEVLTSVNVTFALQ